MGKPAVLRVDVIEGSTSAVGGLEATDAAAAKAAQGLEDLARSAQKADTDMRGIGVEAAESIDQVGGNAGKTAAGLGDLAGVFDLMDMPGVASQMGIVGTVMAAGAGAADLWTVATNFLNVSMIKNAVVTAASAVQTVVMSAAQKAAAIATQAVTAATWLFNAALLANPVGLIIVGIIALIAAIVLLWKNSETFRTIVMAAWDGIKKAASSAWDFIKNVIWPGLKFVIGLIGDYYMALWSVVSTAWGAIVSVISGAWDKLSGFFQKIIDKVKSVIDWFKKITDFKPPDWLPGVNASTVFAVPAISGPAALGATTRSTTSISSARSGMPQIRIYLDGREIRGSIARVVTGLIDAQGRQLTSMGWA
jgi:phage-related protein